ncbi:Tim44 domain-containing protein [Crenobacter cavernae]|uniref:Tim44 domain-containing protein n=1 Tax=Crenobacter cavernae TaxID=2290923 RepID=A0ABY0FG55_9NEIS|nr:TIM44-like domain-containing protein [Crenobacter cavernae]RXZ43657.1 Tim44 domain-containing protein [Crenobacter cavernae]
MITKTKTTLLALTLVSLLAAPLAEAARMGKGRSSGMQRSAPTQSYNQPAAPMAAPARPAAAPQAAPQKGPGLGTALAAGAAGAAAGYMIGKAMDSSAGSSETGSGFPWGTLAIGGLLLVGAMMFFRRRQQQAAQGHGHLATPGGAPLNYQPPQAPANNSQFGAIPSIGSGMGGGAPAMASAARLPDGTETPHFLRQAKATFLHLQSLNTPESLEEVRKYMTPDLFNGLRDDIAANADVADFPQLDCQLAEAVNEGGRYIASVRFTGTVSESVGAPAVPFSETWHYVKDAGAQRWLLAGIQQG